MRALAAISGSFHVVVERAARSGLVFVSRASRQPVCYSDGVVGRFAFPGVHRIRRAAAIQLPVFERLRRRCDRAGTAVRVDWQSARSRGDGKKLVASSSLASTRIAHTAGSERELRQGQRPDAPRKRADNMTASVQLAETVLKTLARGGQSTYEFCARCNSRIGRKACVGIERTLAHDKPHSKSVKPVILPPGFASVPAYVTPYPQ